MIDPRGRDNVIATLGDIADRAGLRRIGMLAWRDLDDPEAGGSEIHASRVAELWAAAGIDVTVRTSYAPGLAQNTRRDGYRVIRKAGRYMVFPRSVASQIAGRHGRNDALIEIWNGMPFFSPVWSRVPHVVWLHHVHDTMWDMTLPKRLAQFGRAIEFRVAPPIYRSTQIVTLSESSKSEIVSKLKLPAANIRVVPPGIDPSFTPDGTPKADSPLVLAAGRLVPVKRFHLLIDALVAIRPLHPGMRAVIVGEGYERDALERQIADLGAQEWISLPGRLDDAALRELYRQAWVLASASAHEGWGMTITEAAASGTPAVATRIPGHSDAIVDGRTGILVDNTAELARGIDRVLGDAALRGRLANAALEHAQMFAWGATACGTLEVLANEAQRRHDP